MNSACEQQGLMSVLHDLTKDMSCDCTVVTSCIHHRNYRHDVKTLSDSDFFT